MKLLMIQGEQLSVDDKRKVDKVLATFSVGFAQETTYHTTLNSSVHDCKVHVSQQLNKYMYLLLISTIFPFSRSVIFRQLSKI